MGLSRRTFMASVGTAAAVGCTAAQSDPGASPDGLVDLRHYRDPGADGARQSPHLGDPEPPPTATTTPPTTASTTTTPVTSTTVPGGSSVASTLGVYPEYFGRNPSDSKGEPGASTQNWSELSRFESWLNRPVNWVMQFGWMAAPTWSEMEASVKRFADSDAFRAIPLGPRRPIVCLPLTVRGTSLGQISAGSHDNVFRRIAQRYVQAGLVSVVFRLGWELDNRDFPWTMRSEAGGDASEYRAAWRRVHDVMMAVNGAQFEWCLDTMPYGWRVPTFEESRAASVWPGDSYVDYCGVDIYDCDLPGGYPSKEHAWSTIHQRGLDACAQFAANHGKKVAIPEWACCARSSADGASAGGDNAYFVRKIADWVDANNVGFHCYFNRYDPLDGIGSYKINPLVQSGTSQFPQAAAELKSRVGI